MKSDNSINVIGILTTTKNVIKYVRNGFSICKIMSKQMNKQINK